jgi:hypothetical protein
MKKIITAVLAGIVLSLASCLETGMSTSINADGSGMLLLSADLSGMMKIMNDPEGVKSKKDSLRIDTTIYLRTIADKMEDLSVEEKALVREMMVKTKIDMQASEPVFIFSISTVFGNLDQLNKINAFMRTKEFEKLIARAMSKVVDDKGSDKEEDMDGMLNIIFLDLYTTEYSKGLIRCRIDTTSEGYQRSLGFSKEAEDIGMDPNDKMSSAMGSSKFTIAITIPSTAKEVKGNKISKGKSDREFIISGNYLDMYKEPKQYEYSISY